MALELLKYLGNVMIGGDGASEDDYWQYLDRQFPKDPQKQQAANGEVIVNGVALPKSVIDQLLQHGFNPEWCSRYELQAAEQEALGDGTVFHDPDGNDFYDDLDLTEDEIEADDDDDDIAPNRMALHVRPDEDHETEHERIRPVMSFREIEKQRRREKSTHGNEDGGREMESM